MSMSMSIVIPYLVCLRTHPTFINDGSGMNLESGRGMNLDSGRGMNLDSGRGMNLESGRGMNLESGRGMNLDSGSGMNLDSDSNNNNLLEGLLVLIVMGPFILVVLMCMIFIIRDTIYDPIYNYFKKIWYEYKYKLESKKNETIVNGKLNKNFITSLNTNNHERINKKEIMDCSICIESIELDKFKLTKNKLVFLNCGHVYHTTCLQSWVKSQIKQINKPDCPLCRDIIINIEDKLSYIETESDDSDYSDYN